MGETLAFPWYYSDRVNGAGYDENDGAFQFVHRFIPTQNILLESLYMNNIWPMLDDMGSSQTLRVKANCIPRTENIVKHGLHQDFTEDNEPLTTSIYYVNDNNGYTYFKDGTIVKSKANRLVSFPCGYFHGGTSCTDKSLRIVINFNYVAEA